jgi:hypothetical protein
MPRRSDLLVLLLLFAACGPTERQGPADPIPGIPDNQQRTVTRSEFRWDWPFTVGTGTLGCASGAVVFRAAGANYGVNDAAKSRGFQPVEPIRENQGSGWPSDPLKRLKQDQRMEIFRASAACEGNADAAGCRHRLRVARMLSEAELHQIDAEGRERFWPPLMSKRMSLDPMITAGLKLCQA